MTKPFLLAGALSSRRRGRPPPHRPSARSLSTIWRVTTPCPTRSGRLTGSGSPTPSARPDVEKDKHNRDIWMVSWDGKEQVQLTSSKDNESRPRWSPDGKYLAFLASRGDEDDKKKGAQVWLLNRSGGEALQLTDIKGGIDEYEWSPDSKRLALIVSDVTRATSRRRWKAGSARRRRRS